MNHLFTTEKYLVLLFLVLFFTSAWFLFWKNERELDSNFEKSWWTLSFIEPQSKESLDFRVDNSSNHTTFYYRILNGKTVLKSESFEVARGERRSIVPGLSKTRDVRTTLEVTAGTEKKSLYR